MTIVKIMRQTLFRMTFAVGIGTAAVGFCRRGERSGLALNMIRKSGSFYLPRSRVRVSEWKITNRKHQG